MQVLTAKHCKTVASTIPNKWSLKNMPNWLSIYKVSRNNQNYNFGQVRREADYPYSYGREHRAAAMASADTNTAQRGQLQSSYTSGIYHSFFTELQLCVRM